MSELLNSQELADMCGRSLRTIQHWRRVGYGPKGVRVGRWVLYRREDVEAWLAKPHEQRKSA